MIGRAKRQPVEHDWTARDYAAFPRDGGTQLGMVAWADHGPMPRAGDYLILRNGDDTTRYKVDEVRMSSGEGEVRNLSLTFAPRRTRRS
jgi:hypothetical protein